MAGLTDAWMQLARDVVQLLLNSLTFRQHPSLKRCMLTRLGIVSQCFRWLGGVVVRSSALGSTGREYDSRPWAAGFVFTR